ncbi:MAG: alpha-N-arabinofuranosidase [Lachnospiraceae bacterium]|nr:alpha-N-arabinofuranosidase [Lachnospiraceae bacterium]
MAKLYINPAMKLGKINKELYGNFSEHLGRCIYEGLYVGEDSPIPNTNGMRNDVVNALKEMKLPVLRWPGGCFADEYHWEDGVGPKESRKKMINTHWGGVLEDNSFGTHEFMELCRQLGCETYVNANVGSGTVREMSEWVEYMTFDGVSPMADLRRANGSEEPFTVNYLGVGNENWGCGGNMTPEHYANEYRRYQTYVRNYPSEKNPDKKPIYKIACGANVDDFNWTEQVMKIAGRYMDGLSLHYYTITDDWTHKGSATEFDVPTYYRTLGRASYMETLINRHGAIMDKYDADKKVGLIVDEWGTWFDCEPGTNPGFLYQQNTMRDAMVAALTLNIFNKHCDRVKMANIAQLVNVLQAVILTEGEKMLLTPTYHVFKMYAPHQNAQLLDSRMELEWIENGNEKVRKVYESASVNEAGEITVTLANLSADEAESMEIVFAEGSAASVTGELLTGKITEYNTFEHPDAVKTTQLTGVTMNEKGFSLELPPCSVVSLCVKMK